MNKHLNELRVKAMAGDHMAQKALESETFVPHHLRQPLGILKYAAGFKRGLAITAKTLKARATQDSLTISPDYGYDRLQMLKDRKDRKERRHAVAA